MTNPLARSRRGGLAAALRNHNLPRPPVSRLDGHPDIELLRGAEARIVDIRRRYDAALGDAHRDVQAATAPTGPQGRSNFPQPDSPRRDAQSVLDRMAAARETLSVRFQAELDDLARQVQTAVQAIYDDEQDAWPTPGIGLDAFMLRQSMRGDAERLLTAGVTLDVQVNEAQDTERVHALIEQIPISMRVGGADDETIAVHTAHATRRLFELAGRADAFDASAEAEAHWAQLELIINATRAQLDRRSGSGGRTMDGAFGARAAGDQVRSIQKRALDLRGPAATR